MADLRQRQRSFHVDRRKIHCSRCPVGQQVLHEVTVNLAREVDVGIFGFERKSVFLKPDFERSIECLAKLGPLRGVDVEVNKARQEKLAVGQLSQITIEFSRSLDVAEARLIFPDDLGNAPCVIDGDQHLVQYFECTALRRMEGGTTDQFVFHLANPCTMSSTSRYDLVSNRRSLGDLYIVAHSLQKS